MGIHLSSRAKCYLPRNLWKIIKLIICYCMMSSVHDVMMYKHDCPCDNPLHHRLSHLQNLHISGMFTQYAPWARFNFLKDSQWRRTSFQVRTNYVRHVQDWTRKIFAWHDMRAAANPPPLPVARWNIEHKLQYHKLISGNLDTWTIFKFLFQQQLWLPLIKMSGNKTLNYTSGCSGSTSEASH